MEPIYIIESPAPEDLFDGRNEGEALYKALKLAECKTNYWLATDYEMLRKALELIASGFGTDHSPGEMKSLYLHISAHGNEKGLGFTNGSFISWKELSSLLKSLSENIGFELADVNLPISRVVLCLSSCFGLSAGEMYEGSSVSCVQAIVGPNEAVTWPDALTAFTTFYHLANLKDFSLTVAVEKMNDAAGLNGVFVDVQSPEVSQVLTR